MNSHRHSFLLCLLLLTGCLTVCQKKAQGPARVVATIDTFSITWQDLAEQYERVRGAGTFEGANPKDRRRVLEDMINEQVTLMEAYRLGLDRNEQVLAVAREKERELCAKALRSHEVDEPFLSEEVLQRFYHWSDRELEIAYMKFFAGETSASRERAQQKADKVYQQVLSGGSFKTLASRFSEHDAAKADSGKIGRIDCFYRPTVFFEQAYPLAEGAASRPFFHDRSIWMVQVLKIVPQTRPPFSQMRSEILEKVQELYQDSIRTRTIKFNQAVLAEYHFSLQPQAIEFFCRRCAGMKTRADSAGLFSAQEKRQALAVSDVETTDIGAFFAKVAAHYWSSLDEPRVVEMLLRDWNTSRLVKHKAMQLGWNEKAAVKQDYRNWLVYYLKKMVLQRQVVDAMEVSEPVLRQLYEQTRSSRKLKRMATVREIFRKTQSDAERVYRLAVQGEDFAALQAKYCQNEENKNHGIVGPFPQGMNGKLGELAFSGMAIGAISAPFKYRGGYSIIQLLSIDPERVKSFDECREEIKAEYIQAHYQEKISAWQAEARKNYKIRVHV